MLACGICGSSEFVAGPAGRMSRRGLKPRCRHCGSLERHRVMRQVLNLIREPDGFADYRLIRFSADPVIDDDWFAAAELSIYGGENSLDVQAIDRADESADVVLCSHVIEHVADDRRAIRELARILSPRGFLLLAYPHAEEGDANEDWGFPDAAKNGHCRGYGRGFASEYARIIPEVPVVALIGADEVTGDRKRFYVASKSPFWIGRLLDRAGGVRIGEPA